MNVRASHVVKHLIGERNCLVLKYLSKRLFNTDGGYDKDYYRMIDGANSHCYQLFANTMMENFHPKSVVDIGCGAGGISASFLKAGCKKVAAFDYSLSALELARDKGVTDARKIDLTLAQHIPAKGDLCICLEVAEHIPHIYARKMCRMLSETAPHLVFTAAPPGQGGYLHINERPRDYWIAHMKPFFMNYDAEAVSRIRRTFNGRMIKDYDENLMVFSKGK